jgi:CheY-like chemotaxis protein
MKKLEIDKILFKDHSFPRAEICPDGNGIEVCNKIKREAITCDIPVIMMSAHYDFSRQSCPAQAFISKPYDIEDLVRIVEEYD